MLKVTIKGGKLVSLQIIPLINPINNADKNAISKPIIMPVVLFPIKLAAMTVVKEITEPTDKSIPPPIRTTVWPKATNDRGAI